VVFMLVPHIIRGQELSSLNRRTFDVGTGTGIDLRMADKPAKPETAAAKAEAPKTAGQPAGATPVSTNPATVKPPTPAEQQPAVKPPSGQPTLRLEPSTANPCARQLLWPERRHQRWQGYFQRSSADRL